MQFYHKTLQPEKNIFAIALQRCHKITSYIKIVMKLQTELPITTVYRVILTKVFKVNKNHISI